MDKKITKQKNQATVVMTFSKDEWESANESAYKILLRAVYGYLSNGEYVPCAEWGWDELTAWAEQTKAPV